MIDSRLVTDDPRAINLTPGLLRAALGLSHLTPMDLAEKTGLDREPLWAAIMLYLDHGASLSRRRAKAILGVLASQLWFVRSDCGQGVISKTEVQSDQMPGLVRQLETLVGDLARHLQNWNRPQ